MFFKATVWIFILEIPLFNANNVDPDLGLDCL